MIESIGQAPDRIAHLRGAQVIPRVTKMQLGNRDKLFTQIRDYDTCFEEFLKPSGNGQKLLQAILLREAFSLFALRGVAIKQNTPTVILDVSCGPGDYSVAWTSQIARLLDRVPERGVRAGSFSRSPAGLAGNVKRSRRAA